jgi:enoyl-[acyl-carrier protein] reductase I
VANGPEVTSPLLETSRAGYAAAVSSSAYSMVSLLQRLGPHMPPGAAALSLTYEASRRVVPGYGGGMSSAKAALESDTRTLAYEAGRKWGVRVNCISAPPLDSRAARAIGDIASLAGATSAVAPLQRCAFIPPNAIAVTPFTGRHLHSFRPGPIATMPGFDIVPLLAVPGRHKPVMWELRLRS